jgi:hypothetical protein
MGGQKVVGGPLTLGSRTGKLYQITIASEWKYTVQATWDRVVGGLQQLLRLWGARDLSIMLMRQPQYLHMPRPLLCNSLPIPD